MSYSPPDGWGKDHMIARKQTIPSGSSDMSRQTARASRVGSARPVTRLAQKAFKTSYGMHHIVDPIIRKAAVVGGHAGAIQPKAGGATHTTRWGIAHDGATHRGVHNGSH